MQRLRTVITVAVIVSATGAGVTTWRVAAQKPVTADSVQRLETVQRPPLRDRADRGSTYYWIEGQAHRTTTRFSDALVVSERGADGDFATRLGDAQGNELAQLNVDRLDASASVLVYRPSTGGILRANGRPNLRATLDWGNEQTYSLWKDGGTVVTAGLEWQNELMRPARAPRRDAKRDIVEIRTEWPGGFAATAVTHRRARRNIVTGTPTRGEVIVSRFTKNDVEIGSSQWFPEEAIFQWSFRGLTEGQADAASLQAIGGWTFTPDAAWVNVQGFAFYHFHTAMAEKTQAARREPGWTDKAASWFIPSLLANEPGCDGLHWLDGSLFRPCCDTHDRCYEKYGCTSRSWWQWWSSWTCTGCNVMAVGCFSSGIRQPFRQYPF